jgi:multiple sugar transport system substrate-binding protein
MSKVTIHDVAKNAGVSPGTVSKYVNKSGYVSLDARTRIQKAIDELHYYPNKAAKLLRTQTTDQIAVVVPNIRTKLFTTLLTAIYKTLENTTYQVSLFITDDLPEKEMKILQSFNKDDYLGVLICSCLLGDDQKYLELLDDMFSTVFLLRHPRKKDVNFYGFDNATTIFQITHELLKANYYPIALYTDREDYSSQKDCITGFNAAYRSMGQKPGAIYSYPFSKEGTYRVVMGILEGESVPKVFISSNRLIADAIAEVALLRGMAIGEQFFVVTLGEESWYDTMFYRNIISTFRPAYQLGESAITALLAKISNPLIFEKTNVRLKDEFPCQRLNKYLAARSRKRKIPTSEKRTLKLAFPDHERGFEAIKCLAAQYEQRYGICIDVVPMEYHDMYNIYTDFFSEKKGSFDILCVDMLWTAYLASKGLLMELDDASVSGEPLSSRYVNGYFEACATYKHRIYGYPFSYGTELLFYRKDLFDDPVIKGAFKEKYKIDLAPPEDWFTFNLIANFFTRGCNPKSPVAFGTSMMLSRSVCNDLYSRIWAYGGEIVNKQGQVCLYCPENVKAYSNLAETLGYTNQESTTGLSELISGNAAMTVTFSSFAPEITSSTNSNVKGKIGFAPVPAKHAITSGWVMGINNYSENRDDSLDFLNWFMRDEEAMAYTVLGGNSAHKNIYDFPEIRQSSPWMELAFKMFPYCRPRTSVIKDDLPPLDPMIIEGILSSAFLKYKNEKVPIEDCLRQAHIEMSNYFENNGFPQNDIIPYL